MSRKHVMIVGECGFVSRRADARNSFLFGTWFDIRQMTIFVIHRTEWVVCAREKFVHKDELGFECQFFKKCSTAFVLFHGHRVPTRIHNQCAIHVTFGRSDAADFEFVISCTSWPEPIHSSTIEKKTCKGRKQNWFRSPIGLSNEICVVQCLLCSGPRLQSPLNSFQASRPCRDGKLQTHSVFIRFDSRRNRRPFAERIR